MMKRLLLYGLLLMLFSACGETESVGYNTETDWPFYRADASMSGFTSLKLPSSPVLLWSYKDGVRTVSSPIVYEGITYWVNRRGTVLGVNSDGEKVFVYDMGSPVEATPIIQDSVLYIGRLDGIMEAIDLHQNDTLWTFETLGQISAAPNFVGYRGDDAVVFGSYDNYMYVVDAKKGVELNHFESGYYINGAVAVWNNHVLFGGCDAWVRLIDCQTGIQTDSLEVQAYIPASPAIMGDYAYVADYAGDVYELQLNKGKIVYHKKLVEATDADGSLTSVPAVTDESVYVMPDGRNLVAISRKSGEVLWKYMLKGDAGDSSPLVCNDKLVVCTKSGIVSILRAKDGSLEWEYDTGEQIVASPAVIKGRFFILTTRGTLFCFGES